MKKVSVVILSYNVPDKLVRCVRSLLLQPEINELILIENHSKVPMADAYLEIESLCKEGSVACINHRPKIAFNFSEGQNYGIDSASNNYILLMNNDAFFKDANTLTTSLNLLNKTTKIVGHKILNLDETVNHFGMYADGITGKKGHLARYFSSNTAELQTPLSVLSVTGACIVMERTSIRFDPSYWFENEDVDFCFEHIKQGFSVICNPNCVIIHEESSTRGLAQKVETSWSKKQQKGSAYFQKKWRLFMLKHNGWLFKQWHFLPREEQHFFKNTYLDIFAGIVTIIALLYYPGPIIFWYLIVGFFIFLGAKKIARQWFKS